MASGQTQYYGLSPGGGRGQGGAGGLQPDNAKIDGALHQLAEAVQPLVRAVPQLAYYRTAGNPGLPSWTVGSIWDREPCSMRRFLHPEDLTLSGS